MRRDDLRSLLRQHVPADAREATHRDRMLELLQVDGDPFHRKHLAPGHFTASAFVLSPDRTDLLLIHHAFLGLWLQPGGHVEGSDSDIFDAALREAREETGIEELHVQEGFPTLLDLDIHAIPDNPRKGEGPHEHFDVRVLLRATTRELDPTGVLDARWVPLPEVEDAGTDDSVRRAVRKLLSR